MRNYTRPNVEITMFDVADIITSSGITGTNGVIVGANELTGASQDMYEIYSKNSAAPSSNVSVFTW